jgi:radical SAM/Cys-rich protein
VSDFIPIQIDSSGDGSILDIDGPRTTTSLRYRRAPLSSPAAQLYALASLPLANGPSGTAEFFADVRASGFEVLRPSRLEIFQINLGKLCNMTCRHCHVDSGPDRVEENMDRATVDLCLKAIDASGAGVVDLTGGAPELNPHFTYLVDACFERGLQVMDRCNLTILTVPRFRHLPAYFAERRVEVVCSLPHYRQLSTDAQRGAGTYRKSLDAIRMLNGVGYGLGDPDRRLTLVTNPVGAFLAGSQASLEQEWKTALAKDHDLYFDRLLALNNMPISRYLEWLEEKGQTAQYLERLLTAFNPGTIAGLMCRNTLSVSWDGYLYDCDFNQQLDMKMELPARGQPHVSEFSLEAWLSHDIRTARHCYGCTAGAGSGCGGAIS